MTIGGSILLIVVGAILRYAISWSPDYVDVRLVGLILMVAGVVGLIIALAFLFSRRRRPAPPADVYEERRYAEPPRRYDEPTRRYGDSEVYRERRYSDPPL